jgi:Flp pilus assembly secretin CpaC
MAISERNRDMVRAFALCAVVLATCTAAAQSVKPKISSRPRTGEKLGIQISEPTPAAACDEHECPSFTPVASAEKPVDKHALLKQKLAELNCLQSEIDELRAATGTPQQILVKLQAIEVSRTKMRKLGFDFATLQEGQAAKSSVQAAPTAPGTASFAGLTINDSAVVNEFIEQLRASNIAKVLAEPNLLAVSGRPASFNVGGEVPLPTQPGSKQAVEFKALGTQVDVVAVAQGDHRVRLELRARIGEIDYSKQLEVEGTKIPAISVRQIDTSVNLKFGQSGVLSGLVQKRTERQQREDEVIDVENEIELLFVVTPELIASTNTPQHASTPDAAAYSTATSDSEERPGERSLRVTKPYTPR